jgi:2,3-bisphosphoglycerate-dependent phosphoglycerate mutase
MRLVGTLAGMYNLVLLRHGHSLWNQENRFTGWYDVDLAPEGVEEAIHGGQMMAKAEILPDVVHTSLLRRHYGDLQGKDKAETLAAFGEEKFMIWRRSFDVPPPAVALDSPHHPLNDARYADLDPKVLPANEALSDVLVRMLPYWEDAIIPDLRANKTVLVAAHGNSLRALVMHLDGLTKEQVVALNIPTGIPLQYTLDKNLKPISSAYLDPEAARIAAEKVANQGKK